jgi:tetratricopeptide (TPR) repeat protein
LIEAHPGVVRAHQLLADIHLDEGRPAQAVASLQRAHDLAPKESAALMPRLTKALLADRTSREAHLMLADLQQQGGDADRAVVVLRHLVRCDTEAAGAALERLTALQARGGGPRGTIGAAEACLALKKFPEALQHLTAVATSNPEMSAEFLHPLGVLIGSAPALAARLVSLLEALEPRSPLPVAVHYARAEAQFHAGQLSPSAASFREVLQSAPERVQEVRGALERFDRSDLRAAEARYLLASIYLDQRDHDAAIRELNRPGPTNAALLAQVLNKYDEILSATPDDLQARSGLLQALLLARQYDRVLEVGRDTLKLKDDESTARVSLAMAEALHEKGDTDGAVRRYFTAYRRDPALAPEVIEKLRRLLGVEGKHPFGCLALGKVLAQEGRAKEAVSSLRSAYEADPQLEESVVQELEGLVRRFPADPQAGMALIALLQQGGHHARAVQAISMHLDAHPDSAPRLASHLDEVLKAEPRHPLANYEQGRALQAIGALARSADRYREAAGLDPALGTMVLRRLQEILAADPACASALVASAELLAARGQPLQAAERLAEAIARSPREAAGLLARLEEIYRQQKGQGDLALLYADACARAGQHERAARAYDQAAAQDLAHAESALQGLDAILKAAPRLAPGHFVRARTRLRLAQGEEALKDFSAAARLAPKLLPEVLQEIEALSERRPDWPACVLLLADLYDTAGRQEDAESTLLRRLELVPQGDARLQILLRLARSASERQDEAAARARMREASSLVEDRNAFLGQVHALHTQMLRSRVARARDKAERGRAEAADVIGAVEACVDLGEIDQAQSLLESCGALLDGPAARLLDARVALRRGDYPRAADQLRGLGPSPLLAFGALRAGDYCLAIETLEGILTRTSDPRARNLLERTYREMIAAELMGGSRRLQAETTLVFEEGAAA